MPNSSTSIRNLQCVPTVDVPITDIHMLGANAHPQAATQTNTELVK